LIQKLKNGKRNLIQKTIKQKNFSEEVINAKTGEVVIKLGDKINYLNAKKLANDGLKDILVSRESLYGKFLHRDVKVNEEEEGTFAIGTELNDAVIQQILDANIHSARLTSKVCRNNNSLLKPKCWSGWPIRTEKTASRRTSTH
jgi:DNA-directed RNA polymerase subunit beta